VSSIVYRDATRVLLRVQHRQHADAGWAALVRSVGDGTVQSLATHHLHQPEKRQKAVALELLTHVFHENDAADADASMRAALEWLFGRVDAHGAPDPRGRLCTNNIRARSGERAAAYARGITMRAVLCATNELKNRWNDAVRDMLVDDAARLGGRPGRTYEAVNAPGSIGDDNGEKDIAEQALADDAGLFRNADPSVPLETLHLQEGDTVLLAKTMCARSGLVKNELLTIAGLRRFSVVVLDRVGARHTIPRARFVMTIDHSQSVKIARKQLPFHHAWAITVNKSQGQTCERTLLDLRRPYWEHGHAYVAPGRTQAAQDTGAFVDEWSCVARRGGGAPVPVMAAVCHPELLARD